VARAAGVAQSYAKALFELARERTQTEAVGRELGTVAATVAATPALADALGRPWVTAAAKRAVAQDVAGRLAVSPLTRDFFALVAAQGRIAELGAIADAYRTLEDAAAGRARARVRTRVALTEDERRALAARLGPIAGGRQVVLEEAVDEAMLGGFVAEIGSQIVDGSLEGQLARLRERLARG
jgi:F-type H+-transporting ATPase subunit delta